MLIDEFIILSNKATTGQQLVRLWCQAMRKLGFDRLLFTLLMDHKTIGRRVGIVAMDNYPSAWLAQYSASRFEEIDPVHHHMFITKGAFAWDSLRNLKTLTQAQTSMLAMAELAGLNNGVGIPLRGPLGELAAVMAASSVPRPPWTAEMLDYADLLTQQFYKIFLRLEHKSRVDEAIKLTDKERQVLLLCAQGRSRAEIAMALGVTTDAVKFRLKGVFCKLEAGNQEVAVLKATTMGLISSKSITNL
jgi:LuxR family quorum sensing-dependent transcriptional regulator